MKEIAIHEADVLIVGTGLAGYRAGIAALDPKKNRVAIVSDTYGPSGSSFTNTNNAIGLIVCHTDSEKEAFVKQALSIASPGTIVPALVSAMAEESERLFFDLRHMGFEFKRSPDGNLMRFPACFLSENPLAYMFTPLKQAHASMKNRFSVSGGKLYEGWVLKELIPGRNKRPAGALFESLSGEKHMAVKAKAVIIAAGGTASLFHKTVSGNGPHGFAAALMKRAGVDFVNMTYFQSLWYETKSMRHWPPWQLSSTEFRLKNSQGSEIKVPMEIKKLSTERAGHVPASHGLSDSALDAFLIKNLDSNGELDIFIPEKAWVKVAPFAHASNGGAMIDENGSTCVQGLFACGESSGGMHGANRIGGAMALSTQVFGQRAGKRARQFASGGVGETKKNFRKLIKDTVSRNRRKDSEWLNDLDELKKQLQKVIIQGQYAEKQKLLRTCCEKLKSAEDWRFRLAIETMILILEKTS